MTTKNITEKEINKLKLCSISELKKLPTDQKVLVRGIISRMRVVNMHNSKRKKVIVIRP
jgi:ribosomal protein S8E